MASARVGSRHTPRPSHGAATARIQRLLEEAAARLGAPQNLEAAEAEAPHVALTVSPTRILVGGWLARRLDDSALRYLLAHGVAHALLGRVEHGPYEAQLYRILEKAYSPGDIRGLEARLAAAAAGHAGARPAWLTVARRGPVYRLRYPGWLAGLVERTFRRYFHGMLGYRLPGLRQGWVEAYTPELLAAALDALAREAGSEGVGLLVETDEETYRDLLEAERRGARRLGALRRMVEETAHGRVPLAPETPPGLRSLGEMIVKTQWLLGRLAAEAAREVYGREEAPAIDLAVVEPGEAAMFYVSRSPEGWYVVRRSSLGGGSWILGEMRLAEAFTAAGKPLYVRRGALEEAAGGRLSRGVYVLVHEAMHKAGELTGPTRGEAGTITWVEGGNELVTWRQLLRLHPGPGEVGELVARESPYLWEALLVAAAARALGYRDVWGFIRDKSLGRLRDEDVERALERRLMRYLARRYEEIPEWERRLHRGLSTKRRWLRRIREEIYSRTSVAAHLGYVPGHALRFVYEYALPVLEASFPRVFVEALGRAVARRRG